MLRILLAHLKWTNSIGRLRCPSVVVVVRRPHSLNIFSSETAWPIKVKFHMEPPWDRETKFVQMVQVTWPRWPPCLYMIKALKNLLQNQKADDFGIWYAASGARVLLSLFSDDPGLTLTYFTARSNFVLCAFVWEKNVKQCTFQKLL